MEYASNLMALVYEKSMLSWLARRTELLLTRSEPATPITFQKSGSVEAPVSMKNDVDFQVAKITSP